MAGQRASVALVLGLVASALAVAVLVFPLKKAAGPAVLFDADGPSPRDPPRSAWARAGEGTAAWMEHHHSHKAIKAHAAHRGRKDRPFDNFIRNAPTEVARALHIPGTKVAEMDKQIKKAYAQKKHAPVKAKGGKGVMLAEEKFEDMKKCDGKPKGCEELAKNILKVAKAISEECSVLYFQEKEYYACEEKHASPLCNKVKMQFPNLCTIPQGETVPHGYIGSESPANIEEEFCQGCKQIAVGGCFASDSEILVKSKGAVSLKDVQLGDEVQSVNADGASTWTPVVFLHDHKERKSTMQISLEDGNTVEMTGQHPVMVEGNVMMPAHQLQPGVHSLLSVGSEGAAKASRVAGISYGEAAVRYIVTEQDKLTVNNIVSSAPSTMLGALETLPFKALWAMGLYSSTISKAVGDVLESPILQRIEDAIDFLAGPAPAPKRVNWNRLLVASHHSF